LSKPSDVNTIRRSLLLAKIHEEGLDTLFVTDRVNVRYLTGYTGSNGLLALSPEHGVLFYTDSRYTEQAAREVSCKVRIVRTRPLIATAFREAIRRKPRKIGFEKSSLSWAEFNLMQASKKMPLGCELVAVDPWVELMRMIKTPEEIEQIRLAVELTSSAFETALFQRFKPGMCERDLAAEIDHQQRKLGAEGPAFETIVASGPHSALPHARPRGEKIAANQLLLIDMGASRDGYTSDMTRTLAVGKLDQVQKKLYRAVWEAQQAALDAIRPGVRAREVDAAARAVFARHGMEKEFPHSTGHGLGMEVHEAPRVGKGDKTILRAGMVITVEPGAYQRGLGGVRIEDTVLVTLNGCRVLTPTPKELMIL
jgi:Xaa-Pro aminopeptidase